MTTETINIILNCTHFPGIAFHDKQQVFVGIQRKQEVVEPVPGDTGQATFSVPVQIKEGKDGQPDFFGPNVHGKPGDRFIYLVWFENKGEKERFRRAKIKLNHLTWDQVKSDVKADLTLTNKRGEPISATVPEDLITWRL
jgi:hypothetical protein